MQLKLRILKGMKSVETSGSTNLCIVWLMTPKCPSSKKRKFGKRFGAHSKKSYYKGLLAFEWKKENWKWLSYSRRRFLGVSQSDFVIKTFIWTKKQKLDLKLNWQPLHKSTRFSELLEGVVKINKSVQNSQVSVFSLRLNTNLCLSSLEFNQLYEVLDEVIMVLIFVLESFVWL